MSEKCKKSRKIITFEQKLDILKRFDAGQKTNDIAKSLSLAPSTVATIKKNKEDIKASIEKVASFNF